MRTVETIKNLPGSARHGKYAGIRREQKRALKRTRRRDERDAIRTGQDPQRGYIRGYRD